MRTSPRERENLSITPIVGACSGRTSIRTLTAQCRNHGARKLRARGAARGRSSFSSSSKISKSMQPFLLLHDTCRSRLPSTDSDRSEACARRFAWPRLEGCLGFVTSCRCSPVSAAARPLRASQHPRAQPGASACCGPLTLCMTCQLSLCPESILGSESSEYPSPRVGV